MNEKDELSTADEDTVLLEGRDFYFENGLMVLTQHYLLDRGYCCERGCRHCPYQKPENSELK
jgi:hypothetical protein